jgi:hypothetical protein
MQNRRHNDQFAALPFREPVLRGDPFTAFKFCIFGDARVLFEWTFGEKEPGIESSRRKRWRYPAANKSEIVSVEMQTIMIEQLRPGHATRFEIIEQ